MNHKKLRILFWGTPDFAAASLEALVQQDFNIVGVVTAPDKPSGRGLEINATAVKKIALMHNLKIFQPIKLKEPTFLEEIKKLDIDLGIVVAFRMMPESLWSLPRLGTFNLHGSLLPQYRGAAPIHWAVIHGEKMSGLTTFFLKHEIDTGDIIFQEKTEILDTDTTGDLYQRMMKQGAELTCKTAKAIELGDYHLKPQQMSGEQKLAPKIYKEMAEINFQQRVLDVYNMIRGMNPFPGAWFKKHNKKYSITACTYKIEPHTETFGEIKTDLKSYIFIYCIDGYIEILKLKLEGKREMMVKDFLNGSKI